MDDMTDADIQQAFDDDDSYYRGGLTPDEAAMIVWLRTSETTDDGMSLRLRIDLPMDKLVAVSGLDPMHRDNYYAPEDGYDGWELHGTFNGEPFSLYTRWNNLRIGGTDDLDVDGLVAALKALIA